MTATADNLVNLLPKTVAKAAEFYAARFGWRVFPLYEMSSSGVCSCSKGADCKTPGKHPRVSIPSGEAAVHPASTDLKQIAAWWRKWPHANIGVWLEGSDLIVLDIDKNDKKDGFQGLEEIMAFERESMPSTLTCLTPSGGKHLYFKFTDGVPNKANALGPGLDTWHTAHYVIVPPSNHIKGVYAWEGGVEKIGDYPEWLKPKARGAVGVVRVGGTRPRGRPPKERLDPSDPEDVARITHALKHVDATNRDIWVSVGFALARAFDWSDAGFEVYRAWSSSAHNYDAKQTEEQYRKQSKVVPPNPITTASIFEWAKQHPNYKGWVRVDDRPFEIRERPDDTLDTLKAVGELIPEFPIYQRGPKIVEIVPVNQNLQTDFGWFPKGSYILREVSSLQLATRILPSKVRWLLLRRDGWAAGPCSTLLCAALLGIGNWPKAKKLRAFVQHPTVRDDGSLVSEIGFDERSGLFVTEKLEVVVPDKPTKREAQAALKILEEPFSEFKWIDGNVSRAALLSAVLTVGVRHLFDEGVPLFAIDAPRQGSGKTKLVKSISNMWFGRPMAVTPYSSDQEEMKKHLAAMMLNGDRVVLFDNVHPMVKVNDPTLNALLTSGRMTFRELGSQRMLEMDTSATYFMTGNRLKIIGDMIRRTIKMHIDPEGLHPMDRQFKIDPLESWVLTHRSELVSAALTVVRAFFVAGKPETKGIRPLPSFEKWSLIVRNCLLWLGMDDVAECIRQGYEDDDESMEMEHLMKALCEIPQMFDGIGSLDLSPIVDNSQALKNALLPHIHERHHGSVSNPQVIKEALSCVVNIPIEGKVLKRIGSIWKIVEAEKRKRRR